METNDCAIVSCTTKSVIGDSIERLDCDAFCMNSNVVEVNLSYQTRWKSIRLQIYVVLRFKEKFKMFFFCFVWKEGNGEKMLPVQGQ